MAATELRAYFKCLRQLVLGLLELTVLEERFAKGIVRSAKGNWVQTTGELCFKCLSVPVLRADPVVAVGARHALQRLS